MMTGLFIKNGPIFMEKTKVKGASFSLKEKIMEICTVKNIMKWLLIFVSSIATSQQPISNQAYSPLLHTPQAYPAGNPLGYPAIGLFSGEVIEFHFDLTENIFETYNYGVIHCDHNWIPSDLHTNEYIQGFPTSQISEMEASFGTMYNYVHYSFRYPDDMSTPRYSGNYAMVVFTGSEITARENWLITYRFIVYENAVNVLPRVIPSSIIAQRYTSQEVDFDINHKDFRIIDPGRDINVSILQNFDWKQSKHGLKPIFIKPDVLTFDYNMGENNFEGANEWRFFEAKDIRFNSSEVETITSEDDGYHVYLRPDLIEGKRAYSTWQDLNGNFLIKNDLGGDPHVEADYVWVHFTLLMPKAEEAEVYIKGRFNEYNTEKSTCIYDETAGAYKCIMLLKQGYYNYRYVLRDRYYSTDNVRFTEGSHAVTENIYHVIVYMNDRNLGCDRIIGVKAVPSVQ
jgi:hypothetical protein